MGTSNFVVNIIAISTMLGVDKMKFMHIVADGSGDTIKAKVEQWLKENEESILEMVDIEYNQEKGVYFAIISYFENKDNFK